MKKIILLMLFFIILLPGCTETDVVEQDETAKPQESTEFTESTFTAKKEPTAEESTTEEPATLSPEELQEIENENLYISALELYENEEYEKSKEIFENITEYKDSTEMLELCGKHIKYLDAKKSAEEKKYGAAAEKYLEISDFLDSKKLYDENIYKYYDEQYQNGNKSLSVPENYDNNWRLTRRNNLWRDINDTDGLSYYYYRNDNLINPVNITGTGIYINDAWVKYGGAKNLGEKIFNDVPVFFLADSTNKVRYVVNFVESEKYIGYYEIDGIPDGTFGYETTTVVIIKDTVEGRILFYKSYTADPPHETTIAGDVYAIFDFFEKQSDGFSVYDKEIYPVLKNLFG